MPPFPLTHLSPLVTRSLSWLPKSVSLCVCKWGPPYGLSHSTCEWHRGISVVLWLPSLSVSISRSIHVAGEGISSFFVVAKVTFRYVYVLILCWQRDCLPVLPVVKCCCEHWRACIFRLWLSPNIYMARRGTAGLYGSSMFSFSVNPIFCSKVAVTSFTSLHSHRQCKKVPFPPQPLQHLL